MSSGPGIDVTRSLDWSPDGAWISFTRSEQGYNDEIFIVRPDGSELRSLQPGMAIDPVASQRRHAPRLGD